MKSMEQVGIDPETGEFDVDVVETGQSKRQLDRRKQLVAVIEEKGAPTADGLTNVHRHTPIPIFSIGEVASLRPKPGVGASRIPLRHSQFLLHLVDLPPLFQ